MSFAELPNRSRSGVQPKNAQKKAQTQTFFLRFAALFLERAI
jgi:hypothetical protein